MIPSTMYIIYKIYHYTCIEVALYISSRIVLITGSHVLDLINDYFSTFMFYLVLFSVD